MKKFLIVVFFAVCSLFPIAAEQISSIDVTPSWVYLYNSQGRKYKTLSVSTVGEVMGYSSSIIVTRKGSWYYIYDADGRKVGTMSQSTVGDVIGVAGDTFTSRKGSWIYTWDKSGKKINTRPAR